MPAKDHHLLSVDPGAIPELRGAFLSALNDLDRQIELAQAEVRVGAWAKDPVSVAAAESVNALSADVEGAALEALLAFRARLDAAVDNLDKTAEQYRGLEDDNEATVTQTTEGG
ncbi:transcriptional regulator [Actinokineospora sp. 24-640]